MSGLDGLQLDTDGFVDMDQFPDDGTDVVGADLDQLRATLHADPVDEPTADQWDAIVGDVIGDDLDDGPFTVDDGVGVLPDLEDVPDPDVAAGGDDTDDVEGSDSDDVDAAGDDPGDDGITLDDITGDDLDLDLDGGLDLTPDDGLDDAYAPDATDDGASDMPSDLEDLL